MSRVNSEVAAREWAAVYEANAGRLTRLATILVGPSDAHDLVADAVMRSVTSPAWGDVAEQGAYLTRTMVNLASDRRVQSARRVQRELHAARLDPPRDTARQGEVERMLVVNAALSSLSAGQLAVVHLHYWEDMSLSQVADHLGLRPGTVRRHLDRAKHRLRAVLSSERRTS